MLQFGRRNLVIVLTLGATVLSGTAIAGKSPKSYPEQGKVVGNGTTGQAYANTTVYTHTYKVETDKAVLVLDCGKKPFFGRTGAECGGDKKIQIGDVLHFRIEKSWAYIPVTDSGIEGEQKLRILSQELKPDATPSKPDTTQPENTNTKPQDSNQ